MDMEYDPVLERLCRLSADFYSGDKSMKQLIFESGIANSPSTLNVATIAAYFGRHTNLIEEWLRWSANKRVTSGWYFKADRDGYVVSFYPKGEVVRFSLPELACAEFLMREVQTLMEHWSAKLPSK
jgi:hypothetical protein